MSMSPHYGESLKKLIDTVVVPFYADLKKPENKETAYKLTIVTRGGKVTGIQRGMDDNYKE
ncbi:MAG: hypothetical protein ABGX83_05505 [Nitrospira sp.]